jgi:hypothetical protein
MTPASDREKSAMDRISRRELLRGTSSATIMFVLTPITALIGAATSSCGDSSPSSSSGMAAVDVTLPNTPACSGVESTSGSTDQHVHVLCVPIGDLDNPPADGASYTTTLTSDHSHEVQLTRDQLATLAASQAVTVTTSVTQDHTHRFRLERRPPTQESSSSSSGSSSSSSSSSSSGSPIFY